MAMFAFTSVVTTACSDDYDDDSSWNDNGGGYNNWGDNGGDNGGNNGGDNGGNSGGGNGGNTEQAPAAPTGVTASVEGPNAYLYVLISWNYDWSVDHWDVYRSTSANGSYSKIGSNVSNSYADENVNYSTTYYYKVKAVSSSGLASAFSDYDYVIVPPRLK